MPYSRPDAIDSVPDALPTPHLKREPPSPDISVVVPVFDEVGALPELHASIVRTCRALERSFEIIYVDDGSRDGSADLLDDIADDTPEVTVLHFRRNFGKSSALAAGFDHVRGSIVVTMDADLQDDPTMIAEFVAAIDEGADLVSGWKKRRHDPLGKRLPSLIFNAFVRRVSGLPLRDFNCGYKAYHIDCIRELSVYGGFHRFLPMLAAAKGFSVKELVVNHRARQHGVSKYSWRRFIDGCFDVMTVLLVTRFRTRPLHFFGTPGVLLGAVGGTILCYLTAIWFQGQGIGHRPLLLLGVLLVIASIQLLCMGLLGELLVKTTITRREVYSIDTRRVSSRSRRARRTSVADETASRAEPAHPES